MTAAVNDLLEKTPNISGIPEATPTVERPQTPEKSSTPEKAKTSEATPTPKKNPTTEKTPTSEKAKTSGKAKIPEKAKTSEKAKIPEKAKTSEKTKTSEGPSALTLDLAAQDVRMVIAQQREQSQSLTTKLNILFVTNGALFTSLTVSRLLFFPSPFSLAELLGFLLNFTLLLNAFLPRRLVVSPNLGDKKFLERYLVLSKQEYQLRMLVNLVETYNANKQRLDDVSASLKYAAYVTWTVALMITVHVLAAYFLPVIDWSSFG